MEVHFAPDLQEKLVHAPPKQGRDAEDLVQDVLARYWRMSRDSSKLWKVGRTRAGTP
jgi:DNA-directed RNA polymerase specialized sigma24 family protein